MIEIRAVGGFLFVIRLCLCGMGVGKRVRMEEAGARRREKVEVTFTCPIRIGAFLLALR